MKKRNKTNKLVAMQIGVYGLGRFGSFWASLLARHPYKDARVVAYSRSSHNLPFSGEILGVEEVLHSCIPLFVVAISSFLGVVSSG